MKTIASRVVSVFRAVRLLASAALLGSLVIAPPAAAASGPRLSVEQPVEYTGTAPAISIDSPAGLGTVAAWGDNREGEAVVPGNLSGVVSVKPGGRHVAALKGDGTVVAWGNNSRHQTIVPADLTGVAGIVSGPNHSIALKRNGLIASWGSGFNRPPVSGLTDIAAGYDHWVGLKSDGTVVAWGSDTYGQTVVPAHLTGVVAVSAGDFSSFAVKSDGTVVSWGSTAHEQRNIPPGLANVVAISTDGSHSVVLRADGSIVEWGFGAQTPPAGLTGVTAIAAGAFHTLALKNDGTVAAWGANNRGQTTLPAGLTGVRAISAAGDHSMAVRDAAVFPLQVVGTSSPPQTFTIKNSGPEVLKITGIAPTGANASRFTVDTTGMLTDIPTGGETTFKVTFTPLLGTFYQTTIRVVSNDPLKGIYDLPLSGTGTAPEIAIEPPAGKSGGTVAAWGNNAYGQSSLPLGLSGVKAISAGGAITLALKTDGTVMAWGATQIGLSTVPASLTGANKVKAISAGTTFNLALRSDGSVVGWGLNDHHQLEPPVANGMVAISASMGGKHALALKSDGTVVAWGRNASGQTDVPADLAGVKAIAAGGEHSLALKDDGTVVAWGLNDSGQSTVPAGLSGVTAIAAANNYNLALRTNGTVVAWGSGPSGETLVPTNLTDVISISAGSLNGLALKADGSVVSWSSNLYGMTNGAYNQSGVRAIAAGGTHSVVLRDFPGFGAQLLGIPTAAQTHTIRNTGTGPLVLSSISVVGGNAADFQVNPAAVEVPAGGSTPVQVTFTPGATGLRQTTLRVVSNDSDEGTVDFELAGLGIPGSAREHWRQLHFGTIDNSGVSADGADANRNGIPNLVEYVLGSDPVGYTTGPGILPAHSLNETGHPQLTFAHPGRAGVTVNVQATGDMMTWTELARSVDGGPFFVVTEGAGITETGTAPGRTVTVSDLHPKSDPEHPKRFLRIRATAR